jgi:phosphate starvation-inducible protein PhoH
MSNIYEITTSSYEKKKKTTKRVTGHSEITKNNLELKLVYPITENQTKTFEEYESGKNLFLLGCAGTGKTFISLYLAFRELMSGNSPYRKVVIIRSAQSSKDMGFLPGTEKQKMEVYELPYKAICAELFGRGDAYDLLKAKGIVEFQSTSFLRGTTLNDSIILFDEAQNNSYGNLKTVLTRPGDNSKVIVCGDTKQDDLTSERYKETSGLHDLIKVFERMSSVARVDFTIDDIVRSGFVKEFIIAEYKLGL